jgi:hypothetical protein
MEPRALKPSRKRQVLRLVLIVWIGAFGVGGVIWGAWPLAIILLGVVAWQLAMAVLIAFKPRSYELHLDGGGFRVHDIFGNVAHDVSWNEVAALIPVNVNAYSFIVVAWVCSPRRPKQGRLRWRRGTKDDDGSMPDTYGMRADALINLMYEYAASGAGPRTAPAGRGSLQAF